MVLQLYLSNARDIWQTEHTGGTASLFAVVTFKCCKQSPVVINSFDGRTLDIYLITAICDKK